MAKCWSHFVKRPNPELIDEFKSLLARLSIEVVEANTQHAESAARLKVLYKVAYVDAFAAALTQSVPDVTLVTADFDFKAVQHLISIEFLHPDPSLRKHAVRNQQRTTNAPQNTSTERSFSTESILLKPRERSKESKARAIKAQVSPQTPKIAGESRSLFFNTQIGPTNQARTHRFPRIGLLRTKSENQP